MNFCGSPVSWLQSVEWILTKLAQMLILDSKKELLDFDDLGLNVKVTMARVI